MGEKLFSGAIAAAWTILFIVGYKWLFNKFNVPVAKDIVNAV